MNFPPLLTGTRFSPPRISARSVPRQHLLHRLEQERNSRLVLVTGGAGFGKTTLIAQWRRELLKSGARVAWLSLVPEDARFATFCASLVGALQAEGLPVGEDLLYLLDAERGDALAVAAAALLGALAPLAGELYLMVDDLHHLADARSLQLLQLVADRAPGNLHLVLASREMPPLLLGRLRASGALGEVGCADLGFDSQETLAFLRANLDAAIDAGSARQIHEVTAGWPIALQLVAIAIKADPRARSRLERVQPRAEDLRAYLLEDVLARLDPALLAFMEKIAVARRFNADLAADLAGEPHAAEFIAQLERANLFLFAIDARDGSAWYRFHPLFAEFLLARLAPAEAARQHLRASRWFAAQGWAVEAIHYALRGEDPEAAIGLIEAAAPRIRTLSHLGSFLRWFGSLPRATVLGHPDVLLAACCAMVVTARHEDAARWLADFPQAARERLQPQLRLLHAIVAAHREDFGTAHALAMPLADVAMEDSFFAHLRTGLVLACLGGLGRHAEALRYWASAPARATRDSADEMAIVAAAPLAESLLSAASLSQAGEFAVDGLQRAEGMAGQRSLGAAVMAGLLAEVLYESGRVEEARGVLCHRLDMLRFSAPSLAARAALVHARLLCLQETPQAALAALAREEARFREIGVDRALAWVLAEQARIALLLADLRCAQRLQGELDVLAVRHAQGAGWCADIPVAAALARGRLALAQGRAGQALQALEGIADSPAMHHRGSWLVTHDLLCALALDALDRPGGADERMRAAIGSAHRMELLRTLADEGEALAPLLLRVLPRLPPVSAAHAQRVLVLVGGPEEAGGEQAHVVQGIAPPAHLTPRERDILGLLAQSMTNKRIALTLNLSYDSVKWNMRNIFAKLGVSSRYEAIVQARRLGLHA